MKVYLDDERATPPGWTRVYWPDEATLLLASGRVTEISLDHDLGDDDRGTGYDVVLRIEETVITGGFKPPEFVSTQLMPQRRRRWKGASPISLSIQPTTSVKDVGTLV